MHTCPNCGSPVELLDIELDYNTRTVRAGGRSCKLGATPLMAFECFWDAYPKAVTVAEIYDTVYKDKDDPPTLDTVRVMITKIRQSFSAARLPLEILRVSGQHGTEAGYLLVSVDNETHNATAA